MDLLATARVGSDYVVSVHADYDVSILALRCSVPGLGAAREPVDSTGIVHRGQTGLVNGWRDRVLDGVHRTTRRLSSSSKTFLNPMFFEAIENYGISARCTPRLLSHPIERPSALDRRTSPSSNTDGCKAMPERLAAFRSANHPENSAETVLSRLKRRLGIETADVRSWNGADFSG